MRRNHWARRVVFAAVGLGLVGGVVIAGSRLQGAERAPRGGAAARAEESGPPQREAEEAMKASGIVAELTTNKHDDIDGLLLKDGTEIKFPPHQAEELEALVKVGDEVRVEGRRHETPEGDVHLHADKITLKATGKSLERDEPAPPQPPKHAEPRRHGPKDAVPPHEQILAELRSLRKLIESQRK